MAQARDSTFNPPSPHSSSGGGDSYKHEGTTPDTRLTVFSPDDNSNRGLTTINFNTPSGHSNHFSVSVAAEKDPFVSSNNAPKQDQKLSPTASAFRPLSVPIVAHGSLNGLNTALVANRQLFTPHPIAKFSSDFGISRCLILYYPSHPLTFSDAEAYLEKLERLGLPSQGKRHVVEKDGRVYLRLSNIRDARNAHTNVQFGSPGLCAEYIAPHQFYQVCNPGPQAETVSEGQVQITAFGQDSDYGTPHVETVVQTFLETQGEVFAFQRLSDSTEYAFRAVVEFFDADLAVSAIQKFHGVTLGGVHLILTLRQLGAAPATFQPLEGNRSVRSPVHNITNFFQSMEVSRPSQQANPLAAPSRFGPPPADLNVPQQQAAMYPMLYHGPPSAGPNRFMLDQTPTRSQSVGAVNPLSPLGGMPMMTPLYTPPATPMGHHGDFTSPRNIQSYGRLDNRRHTAMRVNRSPYYNAAGHHNHVDVNRIRDGIDVRTTIMLRNIPNKVDQSMLKRIVDESSWGKYDFMYLRIDFANDCNVGYAFINFVDPLDIIDFVNARGNQRWNCFKSDKVAEISYARKDCLVQKFRNSSVMLEAPHYRPKLYYTSNGPMPEMAGQEEPFPEPDNQSKMKRSCENAEHVGLFTPNAGQHFRDEQRRRRSQYDRGTRLAALEEYDYEAHMQPQGFFGPQ
ncbi:hypothetical protein BT67DRAFT_401055 [Trichocladium antarcticum]|uniref:RRM domain-containing protein n=1 Tax=Trichocladium antarcticum TaxID=1450529 RepID=A0AAN6ZF72_9PEZI|nr:hypothetical protein BT67DRAFT_401055 [Trichocladium antarcticum]